MEEKSRYLPETEDYYQLKSECFTFGRPGVYRLVARPRGRQEPEATALLRVIDSPPSIHTAVPTGHVALEARWLHDPDSFGCYDGAGDFRVLVTDGHSVAIQRIRAGDGIALPVELQPIQTVLMSGIDLRKRAPLASALVATGHGWLVGTNAGEFGGELFAVESVGLRVVRVETGSGLASTWRYLSTRRDFRLSQNVEGIERDEAPNSYLVFQGSMDAGRMTRLTWQSGLGSRPGRWSARVVADLYESPVAWLRRPAGTWRVATGDGLMDVTDGGQQTTVAQLHSATRYPNSLVEQPDGTLWLGLRGGAVRLIPMWSDTPRYWPEYLVPVDSKLARAVANRKPCS